MCGPAAGPRSRSKMLHNAVSLRPMVNTIKVHVSGRMDRAQSFFEVRIHHFIAHNMPKLFLQISWLRQRLNFNRFRLVFKDITLLMTREFVFSQKYQKETFKGKELPGNHILFERRMKAVSAEALQNEEHVATFIPQHIVSGTLEYV